MADAGPPAPELEPARRETAAWRLSPVWLVPLVALVIALGVAYRTYSERGPTIEIVFDNAAGVAAGQTAIRFRDVQVGLVERIDLSPNLRQVIVTARIDKDVARYIDADATFWVVRPTVSAQGVSGIETVISGVYIGASWDDKPGPRANEFQGLPRPPQTPAGTAGVRLELRAPDGGSMAVGAPVLYKHIQVGQVEDIELTDAGDVTIDVFINAPNQKFVTSGTRFWNASGFSIQLGSGGASLNVDSLLSLLQGGVSFDSVGPDTSPIEPGQIFELYPSETAARRNLFEGEPGERLMLDTRFEGSVQGLEPGALVRYHGLDVGEVTALQTVVVGEGDGRRLALQATLALVPTRLGVHGDDEEAQAMELIDGLVARGLRARLASSGLLATTLYVELVDLPDAPPAGIDTDAKPLPILPSVPSDITSVTASAQGLMQRVSALPLEDVVKSAVALLDNANALLTSDGVRSAPEDLGRLIADLRGMVEDSGIKEAPAQIAAVLAAARALVDQATQAQLVQNLDDTLTTARTAIASIGTAADGVPGLIDQIEALSAKANALPLDELVASAARLVDGMDAFVTSEGVANLPASVASSLAELRGVVADLRSGGAVDNVNATLASVRQMTDEAKEAELVASLRTVIDEAKLAAGNVSAASQDLPALIAQLNTLSATAAKLPLDQLVSTATRTLDSADVFLASNGVSEVPPKLAAALEELRGLLAELREGGAATNVNATLASADRAADAVSTAAADLPALIARLDVVAQRADAALATVGPDSATNRNLILVLQEVRDAARSINALAAALQRQPNAVIFGR